MLDLIQQSYSQGIITRSRMQYLTLCVKVQSCKLKEKEACELFCISRATYYNMKKVTISISAI